jgi:hypothetical protein
MKTHQAINQLLTCVSVAIKQRHLPDLAEVVKQAGTLVNSVHTTSLEIIDEKIVKLVKDFEAKIVAGGEITAQDLVMAGVEPVVADEEEDFTPLPDEVDEEVAEATIVVKPSIKDHAADEDLFDDLEEMV